MRIIDYLLASIGLLCFAPLMLAITVLVKRETPGPALFRQTRVGKGEQPFTCLKFRTMNAGTANLPSHEVGASNITALGARLRRYKLDELPQLLNVIRGEMALVGPRPCLPTQQDLIRKRAESGAFQVLPGITGLAQIQGVDMSEPERLAEIDGHYASTRSFNGDLGILFKTVISILNNKASDKAA